MDASTMNKQETSSTTEMESAGSKQSSDDEENPKTGGFPRRGSETSVPRRNSGASIGAASGTHTNSTTTTATARRTSFSRIMRLPLARSSNTSSCPPSPQAPSYIQNRISKRFHLESTTSEVEQDPAMQEKQKTMLRKRMSQQPFDKSYAMQSFMKTPVSVVTLFIFLVFAGAGIAVARVIHTARKDEIVDEAMALAEETGLYFAERLNQAILPLFSLAQFAIHLQVFQDLPAAVGPAGGENSLPLDPETYKRNITGVCDDPDLVDTFVDISSSILQSSMMDGILVNLQLAPNGVICLLHPMNNTQDFDPGEFLDNTPAWGLDLFQDPGMSYIAKQTIKTEQVGIAGPLTLKQCPTCDLFFVARLPIRYEGYEITVDGESYPRWGFATALIAWTRLVEESSIQELFEEEGFRFQLTRTDRIFDPDNLEFNERTVILAETPGYGGNQDGWRTVSQKLETTNNEWEITVAYEHSKVHRNMIWIMVACLSVSMCIAFLVHTVLSQKHAQADMKAESSAQEAKVDTERNMTAYFAHELRNPLSALDSALNSITKDDLPASTKELLDGMQLCSSFMSSIMNNLLDVRKIEEGKMRIRSRPLSLSALVLDLQKMMRSSVRPGVILLTRIDVPPEKEWVLGDAHRIQQVLTNVLTNAIKYTLEGSITIAVSWVEDMVMLECIDTGPGIPKSEQEQLFERFVQRGGAPGTGLGLNIAKQIVTMMQGSIGFDSDPTVEPGTTCRIFLPLAISEQPEEVSRKPDNILPLEDHIEVLIIDDIKMNRTMLNRRIKKAIAPQASISMAETGEQALDLMRGGARYDIVICDQFMEEAGGVLLGTDTIIAMRRNKIDSFVIGCSGNDLEASFYEAGADLVWGKPMPTNAEIISQWRDGLLARRIQRIAEGSEEMSSRRSLVDDVITGQF